VRLLKEAAAEDSPIIPTDGSEVAQSIASKINWKYAASGLLVLAAFFVLIKLVITPTEPTITLVQPPVIEKQPVVEEAAAKPETKLTAEPTPAAGPVQTTAPVVTEEPKKAKVVQKKNQQKATVETKMTTNISEKSSANAAENKATANAAAKHVESKTEKDVAKEKSGWQTIKDSVTSGTERKCTQAEIALNQCVK
jgi:outer membrane biosynthesis protein TonB